MDPTEINAHTTTREDERWDHLERGKTHLCDAGLDELCHGQQGVDGVVAALVVAEDASSLDLESPPGFDIDDEHTARPYHDQINVGVACSRPAAIWQQSPSEGFESLEPSHDLLFGGSRQFEPRSPRGLLGIPTLVLLRAQPVPPPLLLLIPQQACVSLLITRD